MHGLEVSEAGQMTSKFSCISFVQKRKQGSDLSPTFPGREDFSVLSTVSFVLKFSPLVPVKGRVCISNQEGPHKNGVALTDRLHTLLLLRAEILKHFEQDSNAQKPHPPDSSTGRHVEQHLCEQDCSLELVPAQEHA